jgi:hypothetical protein
MFTSRYLIAEDYETLLKSLAQDEFHKNTVPEFFVEPETITLVYSDEKGIVLFLRGKGIEEDGKRLLRLDIQFLDNFDGKRNLKVMLDGFPKLAKQAKDNKFSEIHFDSNVELMRRFCIKRLGFVEGIDDNLVYVID